MPTNKLKEEGAEQMNDLLNLIGVLNGTLAALPQIMECCTFVDDEKLAKKQSDVINNLINETCSNIQEASRIVLGEMGKRA